MTLKFYRTTRRDGVFRVLPFWEDKVTNPELRQNWHEVLSRADLLLDGLEMLVPEGKNQREASYRVLKAVMVAYGAFVLEGKAWE